MPNIGDLIYGPDIGYKSHVKLIWAACEKCGKERWIQLIGGKPIRSLCLSCALKGKPHHRIVTEEQRNPKYKLCKKCGRTLPATREYFPFEKETYCNLSSPCKECCNKHQKDWNLRTGKTKRTREQISKESKINKVIKLKTFNELRQNRENIKGALDEIRQARNVGLAYNGKVIWHACIDCGKERWVRLVYGELKSLRCHICGNYIGAQKQCGKSYIPPTTQKIMETGVRECTRCHKLLPATKEIFGNSKTKLGIGCICRECQKKLRIEKRDSLGQVESICRVCGRVEMVWVTSKRKGICNGCSQRRGGKQKFPRGEYNYKPPTTSICRICKIEYPTTIEYFRGNKSTKNGLSLGMCRKCLNRYEYRREIFTIKGKLNRKFSNYIYQSLAGTKSGRHWADLVGYTVDELKEHLESQFTEGMTWNNYGEWHIDHIIPLSAFHYTLPEDIDFKICWSLDNLQPLWAKDNVVKSNSISHPIQSKLPQVLLKK